MGVNKNVGNIIKDEEFPNNALKTEDRNFYSVRNFKLLCLVFVFVLEQKVCLHV